MQDTKRSAAHHANACEPYNQPSDPSSIAHRLKVLRDAPTQLQLPTDRPRMPGTQYSAQRLALNFSKKVNQGLRAWCEQHCVNLDAALLGSLAILLGRWSGQDSVLIAAHFASRGHQLSNATASVRYAVPLLIKLTEDETVGQFLARVNALVTDADEPAIAKVPVGRIEGLYLLPQVRLALADIAAEDDRQMCWELSLSLTEASVGLTGSIHYASELFDQSTIERMVESWVMVLEAIASDAQESIGRLPLLTAAMREQVLYEFNDTAVDYRPRLIHELFEEQVERTPDAEAVTCAGEHLTYRQLDRRANQLARHLQRLGVGPDCFVGLCVERGIEMIVGMLGILKAGGAYVPLDPNYPTERLEFILGDTRPKALLTTGALKGRLAALNHAISLDTQWERIAVESATRLSLSSQVGSDNLAYVIYTSGSTGVPKGVAIEHHSAVNLICWARDALPPQMFDRTLLATSINFDLSVYECFVPLAVGGTCKVVRNALALINDPTNVTLINTVPSAIRGIVEADSIPAATRVVNLAGEPLQKQLVDRILASSSVELVNNLYGPSETTTYSTWVAMRRESGFAPTIGQPIANTQIYILDRHGEPVPIGVTGEIYIGGAGVARGYLNRPELTTERFLPDHFTRNSRARMYKTGDLGRWRVDGAIEYLGRNDHQVKIRGFRIELGEVETRLAQHTHVRAAVVVAREDIPGDRRLVAYVARREGTRPTAAELRAHLDVSLPEFMVPSAFVVLDNLPLTENGKVDRKALPVPGLDAYVSRHYEAPHGTSEVVLAKIWEGLLRVERVGRQDNFFALGGHSLLLVKMIEQLREAGLWTDIHHFFESPTLADLARMLSTNAPALVTVPPNLIPEGCTQITPAMLPLAALEAEHIDRIAQVVPGGAANVKDVYSLAPLQEGMFFHHLLSQHAGDTYVRPLLLELSSKARLEQFIAALQAVIDRHDILRTAVIWEQLPRPLQVVLRHANLPVEELALEPARDALEQIKEKMRPELQRLDVRQAPLMRLQVAKAADGVKWYALLQTHHLVFDDESLDLMLTEVTAWVDGRVDELSEPVPYRNHVAYAMQHARTQDVEEFFRRKLGELDEPSAPFGLTDVHGDGSRIQIAQEPLDPNLARQARLQARRLGVSAATLFHAVWGLVVAGTSGRTDVVFGSVLLGRLQGSAGAQRIMGMFINTLPLRLTLDGLTAENLVEHTQRELVDLLKHEQASLAVAQRCSGVSRSAPLFTALLNFRHGNSAPGRSGALAEGIDEVAFREWTNYPLVLSVDDLGEGFDLSVQTDRRIEPKRVIEYVSETLRSLVTALENASRTPALMLQILPERERRKVVVDFNATQADYPKGKIVHELFERQVELTPGATAVVCGTNSLTYDQLNRRANRLARHLKKCGVGPDKLVAIGVERSTDMIIALLATLKVGGAYLPLDVGYPADRLAYILSDSAPVALITHTRLQSTLCTSEVREILLDAAEEEILREADANLETTPLELTTSDLAYVIYTSGSTGNPKGVMVTHANLVNVIQWHCSTFELQEGNRCPCMASLGFDAAVWEIWPTLSCGATLMLAPPQTNGDAEGLLRWWASQPLDVSFLTTPLAELAFSQNIVNQKLRTLLVGGDRLHKLPEAHEFSLVNNYGPTETTVIATSGRISNEDTVLHIGRPISNVQIYILDRQLKPVPIEVAGEIYIGGAGVARGYLNRPDLTQERFVPDLFSTNPQARLYKSGDLARWRVDGTIEFLGRNDDQVKIRGFRIELGEVEGQLLRHQQVKEAAVVAREDGLGNKRLVAYVVPVVVPAIAPLTTEKLRTDLSAILPEYMVPSAVIVLDRLPLMRNGKLDRRALPEPDFAAYATRQYEAPQGVMEQQLSAIWQELLQVPQVGRQDNFFELGGHSLLIVHLMERLRRLGVSTEARRIFKNPTLAGLAAVLTDEASVEVEIPPNMIPANCVAITPQMLPLIVLQPEHIEYIARAVRGGAGNIQDVYPLAPLQEGMLFHHLLDDDGGDTYVVATLLKVSSRRRLDQLIVALQALIDRHDILRTAVMWERLPQSLQVVCRQATLPVDFVSLDPDRPSAEQIKDWMKPERQKLELRRAPLMRLQAAEQPGSEQWYALLQIHHMVDDGTSLKIMISEVVAHLEGRSVGLPEPIGYRNHVAQALFLARTKAHEAEEFFSSKLGDLEEPTTPFGMLDVHADGSRIEQAREEFSLELAQRARAQARHLGVSMATLFHAAWALVVACASGRDDVVFGSVLLGRLQGSAGAKGIVGMFINTLPLRLKLKGVSAREFVEQTQRELIELLNHEQASLAVAQRCSGISGSVPLFSAVLNYRHSTPAADSDWSSAAGIEVLDLQYRTNYPISLSIDDLGEGLTLTAQTDRRVDPRRIAAYTRMAMQSLVQALDHAPHTPALMLPVLPENERRQILDEFNATAAGYPKEMLLHELFEDQAARTPNAAATVYDGNSLSYCELNAKANQLARYLRENGVGPDLLVGLCVERSLEMIVGLLGILKAGGAYLPLDPTYPAERLQHMLEDAAPQVLLIQEKLRAVLPQTHAVVMALDTEWGAISSRLSKNLDSSESGLTPDNLAYVIYTSGSTGKPKGVTVEHVNAVNLWRGLEILYAQSAPCQRVAVNASLNFDASVQQLVQLLSGRTLYVVPQEIRRDASLVLRFLADNRIEAIDCTPSQLKAWISVGLLTRGRSTLRIALVGGEPIDAGLWNQLAQCHETNFFNVYGPTECTVDSTAARLEETTAPHIGRPMANRRVYILNPHGQPVPVGVGGEIFIGGEGVARGYLNRPELTAERFLPDPFSDQKDARMYRTGDVGLWDADGTVEYMGRNDRQVKVRGFRIELGEIEAQLEQHPHVKDAVVIAHEDEFGEKRLAAYVAADMPKVKSVGGEDAHEAGAEMLAQWNKVHDETYATVDREPSFVGWNSSYTGEPIPEEEMQEWLMSTLKRIQALEPHRVLEIGCGVGLLLQHLAPKCEVYVGTDFAAPALVHLQRWMSGRKEFAHVGLLHRSATQLQDIQTGSFDTIILNSVVQYFPDIDYLVTVLQEALRLLAPGGNIFLGDIRHLESLQIFHSAVQLGKAAANVTIGQLKRRIERAVAQDKELVIDPRFFAAFTAATPGLVAAEVQLKVGLAENELTRYRYDAVLKTQHDSHIELTAESLDWKEEIGSAAELEAALKAQRWPAMHIVSIPNARLWREAAARRLIESADERTASSDLRRQLSELELDAVDPNKLWELAERFEYDIEVNPADHGTFEAKLMHRSSFVYGVRPVAYESVAIKPWSEYANDPLENAFRLQLIPRLREYLKDRLPEYMIPSGWMVLKQLPLTPSGKVDRKALPAPDGRLTDGNDYVAPRTALERTLADIWAQVLRVDQVGVHDNFFDLGGHSLLATQIITRICTSLSIEMPMRLLFEFPTIQDLSVQVDDIRRASLLSDIESGGENMDELLGEVSAMSESSVQQLIRELKMGIRP